MTHQPTENPITQEAVRFIQRQRSDFKPQIAIILGSGLGPFVDTLENKTTISYGDIPGFSRSTVAGHKGQLHLGTVNNIPLVCLEGRPHYYEGVENETFHHFIRSLRLLGCDTLIATNASGSLRQNVPPGEVVLITDHINFQQRNPLIGTYQNHPGPQFMGLEDLYSIELRQQFHRVAKEKNITLHEGVYFSVLGPVFETPAEIRAFKLLGADVIGMSTVPEIIVAHHCGMKVAVLAAITNLAVGMHPENLTHEVTLQGAKLAGDKLFRLLQGFLQLNASTRI